MVNTNLQNEICYTNGNVPTALNYQRGRFLKIPTLLLLGPEDHISLKITVPRKTYYFSCKF